MTAKNQTPRATHNTDAEPAPGNEPDLALLGAHESRNATQDPPPESPERLNARMRRAQDYQGL